MRDSKSTEGRGPPEGSRGRRPDDPLDSPWAREGSLEHGPVGGDGAPQATDASGSGQVGRGEALQDRPEEVAGGQRREVGVHRREDEGRRRQRGGSGSGERREEIGVFFSFLATTRHGEIGDLGEWLRLVGFISPLWVQLTCLELRLKKNKNQFEHIQLINNSTYV